MVTADFFAFSATLRFLVLDDVSVCTVLKHCYNIRSHIFDEVFFVRGEIITSPGTA
jgi:hypothetical protein